MLTLPVLWLVSRMIYTGVIAQKSQLFDVGILILGDSS